MRISVLLLIKVIAILSITFKLCFSNQCFKPGRIPSNMILGQKLDVSPFEVLDTAGPMTCSRNCMLYSLCKSVNYETKSHHCELLSVGNGHFMSSLFYNFIDIRSWTTDMLKSCQNHTCPINTYCQEGLLDFTCVPFGCKDAPSIAFVNTTSFIGKIVWKINETVLYPCKAGYIPSANIYCTSTGKWSQIRCSLIKRCTHIMKCENGLNPNDAYLLFIDYLSDWLMMYCSLSNMYISLHYPAVSTFSIYKRQSPNCSLIETPNPQAENMGTSVFSKVRLPLLLEGIKITNRIFANTTYKIQNLTTAGDCYTGNNVSECGVLGYFKLDLRETGIRVKPNVEWVTYGDDGVIYNITRSYDNQLIEGYCGGNCGGCKPDIINDILPIELIPGYIPPLDRAFACKKLVS